MAGVARGCCARVSGDVTLVIACTTVAQGSCAAAMAELVHFSVCDAPTDAELSFGAAHGP